MVVYIKDFKFKNLFNTLSISFRYFTGYNWKKLSIEIDHIDNVTVYTRLILESVKSDLCGKETDIHKKNDLINQYNLLIASVAQLNTGMFTGATKIFN